MIEELLNLNWSDRHDLFNDVQRVYYIAQYKQVLKCHDWADLFEYQERIQEKYHICTETFNNIYDLYFNKPNLNALRVELYFMNTYK